MTRAQRWAVAVTLSLVVLVAVSLASAPLIPDRSIRTVAMFVFGMLVGRVAFAWADA